MEIAEKAVQYNLGREKDKRKQNNARLDETRHAWKFHTDFVQSMYLLVWVLRISRRILSDYCKVFARCEIIAASAADGLRKSLRGANT